MSGGLTEGRMWVAGVSVSESRSEWVTGAPFHMIRTVLAPNEHSRDAPAQSAVPGLLSPPVTVTS